MQTECFKCVSYKENCSNRQDILLDSCEKFEKKISPTEGGCWICFRKDENLVFDTEYDTFVHTDCIKKELETNPMDQEAQIMSYLLD